MSENSGQIPDTILDVQRQFWLDGKRPSVEELLRGTPFENSAEAELDLLYNEIAVKEELGLQPREDEYIERYPHLMQDLQLHFEIHRAINSRDLAETDHSRIGKTWPESKVVTSLPGLSSGNYEIIKELGQGGMAIVYQARHRTLQRIVALKLFQPGRRLSKRELYRIRREAEATARLSHPNIVQIFEIGDDEGTPFLALELAEQGTLARKLQQFPFSPIAAANLIEILAIALQHAHDRHVIHRDLKPANIVFTKEGTPKITDFGLAKVFAEGDVLSSDATRTGEMMGTPRYMSPEQASGLLQEVGPATDVYALGNILYECLTGRAPFVSSSVRETLQKIREEDPLPLRRLQPSIPIDLETICLHCLEKEPTCRYSSAALLAEDLRRFQEHRSILARPTPFRERIRKWCRRRPAQATLISLSLVALLFAVTASLVQQRLARVRLDSLRQEISALIREGRELLERDEVELAQARFHSAWMKVRAEPVLSDHETSVAGWLDHARNAANRHQSKNRVPPRNFDHKRDEALLTSLLLFPDLQSPEVIAQNAIREAMELTVAGDPAWELEREQLQLIDLELVGMKSGPEVALKQLDATIGTNDDQNFSCNWGVTTSRLPSDKWRTRSRCERSSRISSLAWIICVNGSFSRPLRASTEY